MRITNMDTPSFRGHANLPSNKAGEFRNLLKTKIAENKVDNLNIPTEDRKNVETVFHTSSIIDNLERVHMPNINDKPVTIVRPLTETEKTILSDKYDIENMEVNSEEYYQLMDELYALGVTSGVPSSLPLGVVGIQTDHKGNVTSVLSKVDKIKSADNLTSWFSQVIESSRDRYEELLQKDSLSQTDILFKNQFDSYDAIHDILKDLY